MSKAGEIGRHICGIIIGIRRPTDNQELQLWCNLVYQIPQGKFQKGIFKDVLLF